MKHSKELPITFKLLARGALSLILVFSMAFSVTTLAYADAAGGQAGEGTDVGSTLAVDSPTDATGTSDAQGSEEVVDETLPDATTDDGETTGSEASEGEDTQLAEPQDPDSSANETDSDNEPVDNEEVVDETMPDGDSAASDSTEDVTTEDSEEAATLASAAVVGPEVSAEGAFTARDISGKFSNSEGVADAISWTLTTDGVLTVNGTGGIRNYAFSRANGASVFSVGYSDGDTIVTREEIYDSITSIVVGEGITTLGVMVFSPTSYTQGANIKTVSLPSTLTAMDSSFMNISGLTTVNFASGSQLTTIGNSAFQRCGKLTLASLPDTVTTIGANAFSYCASLALTSLPDTVTAIGNNAFQNCTALALTSLPSTLTTTETYAFDGCASLALTSLPASLTTIGNYGFRDCTSLAITSLPSTLTTIGTYAFDGCASLALTSLPASLTTIGNYGFRDCTSLAITELPNSLTSMGNNAFQGCTSLKTITLPDGMVTLSGNAFSGCTSLETVIFPDSVTAIGATAFSGCSSLVLTEIPDSVATIGNNAFQNCISLTTITFGDGLKSIGQNTFSGCTALTEVTFSEGLESIARNAFLSCTDLAIRWFPDSMKNIDANAFYGCTAFLSLDRVSVSMGTTVANGAFPADTKIRYRTNMPVLDQGSFDNTEGVTNAISWTLDTEGRLIITGVGGVGDLKFHKSSTDSALSGGYMTEDETPVAVSQAEAYESIKIIIIDDDITTLGNSVFAGGGANIQTVSLPGTLTAIGNSAFEAADSLASITFAPASQLKTIGNAAFKDCGSLVLDSLPATVTTIGDEAFSGCTSFASLSLTEGLKTIGSSAFAGCSALTIDWFPDSLESIGSSAFAGCTAIAGLPLVSVFCETAMIEVGGAGAPFPEGTKLVIREPRPIVLNGTFANAEGTADAISWRLEGGILTINGSGGIGNNKFHKSNAASVFQSYIIEEDGTRVTAAMQYESITSVVIGEGITSLGTFAFTIPNGDSANIEAISLPATLTTIGTQPFRGVDSLKTVTIASASQLATIGTSAFQGCSSLMIINLPASLTNIGGNAFDGCSSLGTLTLSEGLETIGSSAFANCTNLKISHFPNSLVSIGANAFNGCSAMSELEAVSVYGATMLVATSFPDNVNVVLRDAPGYYIAPGIIWGFSENGDGELTLTVSGGEGTWDNTGRRNFFAAHPEYAAEDVKHLIFEEGITSVPANQFGFYSGFSGLKTVYLAASVEIIGGSAFDNSLLHSLTIAENSQLKSIGQSALQGCPNLTTLDFSDTLLTTIDMHAFRSNNNVSGLTEIFLPETYTTILSGAFMSTSNLKSISLPYVTSIESTAFGSSGVEVAYVSRNIEYVDAKLRSTGLDSDNAKMTVTVVGSSTTPIEGLDFANITYEYYKDTTNSDEVYDIATLGHTIAFICDNLVAPVTYTVTALGAVEESSEAMRDFKAKAYDDGTILLGTTGLAMEDANGNVVEGLGRDATLSIPVEDEAFEGKEVQIYAWTNTEEGAVFAQTVTVADGVAKITVAQPNTSYGVLAMEVVPVIYTVSFESDGGTVIEPRSIEEGKLVSAPNDPVRSGYTFTGWYKDAELTEVFYFSAPIASDTTIYAGWKLVEDEEPEDEGEEGAGSGNNGGGGYVSDNDFVIITGGAGGSGSTITTTQTATSSTMADADDDSGEDSASDDATSSGTDADASDASSTTSADATEDLTESDTALAAPDQEQGFPWWWIVAGLGVVIAFLLGALLRKRRGEDR